MCTIKLIGINGPILQIKKSRPNQITKWPQVIQPAAELGNESKSTRCKLTLSLKDTISKGGV